MTLANSDDGIRKIIGALYSVYLRFESQHSDVMVCDYQLLDSDMRYLGAPNGVIDLDTGKLLSPQDGKKCLVTYQVPDAYNPEAYHSDVDLLFNHLDKDTRDDVLNQIAYSLRGSPSKRFLLWEGEADSGKTGFLQALRESFGNYVYPMTKSVISRQRNTNDDGPTPGAHTVMPPVRVAYLEESEYHNIDPAKIKLLTGGSSLIYRPLYQNPIEGLPSATMVLCGNSFARVGINDPAVAIRAVPSRWTKLPLIIESMGTAFGPKCADQLEAARRRQALVALLVGVCSDHYKEHGMRKPELSDSAKTLLDDIKATDRDSIEEWVFDHIEREEGGKLVARVIYNRYKEANQNSKITQASLTRKINQVFSLRTKTVRSGNEHGRGWEGLKYVG